jgi:hypothetical protein
VPREYIGDAACSSRNAQQRELPALIPDDRIILEWIAEEVFVMMMM